jgi:probable HAF family extracellular repeat protein
MDRTQGFRGFLWSDGVIYYVPTLGGASSALRAINDAGQAVGWSMDANGNTQAIMYEIGSGVTALGTLGGVMSQATAINASGQIAGVSATGDSAHAFLWQAGTMRDLGDLGGGWSQDVYAISDAGQVIGISGTAAGKTHPFLWESGTMQDLGTLGGDMASAYAVNTAGQVAGTSLLTKTGSILDTIRHSFLWEAGTMRDLGTFGGAVTWVNTRRCLNEAGEVVGQSSTSSGEFHAFWWHGGTMQDLGTPGVSSTAVGINRAHQIFGTWGQRGFFYDPGACAPGGP